MRTSTLGTCTKLLIVLAAVIFLAGTTSAQPSFTSPPSGQYNLEGCRNDGTILLPNGQGKFICPDAAYTSGNLGKGWNELDLVPFRLTTNPNVTRPITTTTYNLIVAGDLTAGTNNKPGWDAIGSDAQPPQPPNASTGPTLNILKSDPSCNASWSDLGEVSGVTGGTNTTIYRILQITQNTGSTCVFDYYQRLAVGSHLYSGSSLQAYQFEALDFKTGKQTVSLPVNQITPQTLSKTMTAIQNSDHGWSVSKEVPATETFPDICSNNQLPDAVTITVNWTKTKAPNNGPITITTVITATNPASRAVTISVTDNIYLGLTQTSLLDTKTFGPQVIDANKSATFTHTFVDTVNVNATSYNDVATGTYIDTVTGVPIPETTTATACVGGGSCKAPNGTTPNPIQVFNENATALIKDVEDVVGTGFSFAVTGVTDSSSGGTFENGYTLNQFVGPGTDITYDSGTLSSASVDNDSGTITFTKSLSYTGPAGGSGTLSDKADLQAYNGDGTPGMTTSSGLKEVGLVAKAKVSLEIDKTINPSADQIFTFDVTDSANQPAGKITVSFTSGGLTTISGSLANLAPGTYSVTEESVPGWTPTPGSYTGIDLSASQTPPICSATRAFTNQRKPELIVIKHVVNDNGGTALASEFAINVTGSNPNPASFNGAESPGTTVTLDPGNYNVSETVHTDYAASYSADCTGTVAFGDVKTCTITNDDIAPKLTLVKTVKNDNGGTAVVSDFPLFVNGNPVTSGVATTLSANVLYTATETNKAGYAPSAWGGDCAANGTITLQPGDDKTCTITNDDQTAHLKLVKTVTNDNGGTAVATDFTVSAAGPTPISGAGGAESDVNAGTYNLSETNVAGYTAGNWSCVGGTFTAPNKVVLALNESATCTINNDDIAPKLHLRKIVTNNNGGTATVANFTLTADGTGSNDLSGTSPVDSGAGLKADTWALSETNVAGYSASAWVCVGGTQNGSNVTVGIGGEATCTITNDDQQAYVIVNKVVNNNHGGSAKPDDFKLTLGGNATTSGTKVAVNPGTYTAGETLLYGYAFAGFSGDCNSSGQVTVALGETKTCTLTNNDVGGTIIIKKIAKPVNTGSFGFTVTGTGYSPFTLPGGGQNSQSGLNAGTYTATEGTQLGWILTGIGMDPDDPNHPLNCAVSGTGGSTGVGDLNTQTATIKLKNGDTVTCVFENTGNGATRTQGFWATHSQLANIAWNGGTAFGHTFPGVGDKLLCGRTLDLNAVMGGFWSSVSTKSTGAKRTALDQARMQLVQQLLAAELNASAFGSVPPGGSGQFATWETAYCGTSQTAIKNAQQQAASFNTNGDSSQFTPGTSADSKYARAIANYLFWDVLP